MQFQSINPATGETLEMYSFHNESDVTRILARAESAAVEWRKTSLKARLEHVELIASTLRRDCDNFAALMATEMGKPVSQGVSEILKCAWVCDYYRQIAKDTLNPKPVATDSQRSYVSLQPLGTILAVMPWNFPFWQVFRFAIPNLIAGNTVLLKHALNVPGCALAIEKVFQQAGFPTGCFQNVFVADNAVERIIANPIVKGVTLTGSTRAGSAVASIAGREIKKTVLELGGSDPYIILADADVERAAETCVASRLINSGQSCIAAKRFIVHIDVLDQFREIVVRLMRSKKIGDPFDQETDVGPMARVDLRDSLHEQVTSSVDQGASLLLGGAIPTGPGSFYPLTVLSNVRPGMPAFEEELFGPVVSIIAASSEEDAIRLANRSIYGLGAAVFTRDEARGLEIAEHHIEAGSCFVNAFVKSDPRLPFGGIKQSGYGRELGDPGITEFMNIKTVYLG